MPNVEDLDVYQRSHSLALEIYRITTRLPKDERFGLIAQMRRSASSVPMNLAEGCGRSSDRELRRYVDTAQGSMTELRYQLKLSHDLGWIDDECHGRLRREVAQLGKMLHGLRNRLIADI